MPIKCVDGDVRLGAGKPFVMNSIPFEYAVPFSGPRESARVVSPESLRIFPRAGALSQPVFLQDTAGDDFRRGIFLIHGRKVGDIFRLRNGESAHVDLQNERRANRLALSLHYPEATSSDANHKTVFFTH